MLGRKIQKLMIPDDLVLNSATVQGQLTVDGVITSNENIDLKVNPEIIIHKNQKFQYLLSTLVSVIWS